MMCEIFNDVIHKFYKVIKFVFDIFRFLYLLLQFVCNINYLLTKKILSQRFVLVFSKLLVFFIAFKFIGNKTTLKN